MEKEKEENIWRMKNREISGEVKYFLFRVEGKGEKCLEKEKFIGKYLENIPDICHFFYTGKIFGG